MRNLLIVLSIIATEVFFAFLLAPFTGYFLAGLIVWGIAIFASWQYTKWRTGIVIEEARKCFDDIRASRLN